MSESRFERIGLFGDGYGIPQLLPHIPRENIACIVTAGIRPQYIKKVDGLAGDLGVMFLVQPRFGTDEYEQFFERVRDARIDMILCNSYSMMIRGEILRLADGNAVNIHWALLPGNRGANPVQWAIIKGEKKTGITIHYMEETVDSGDVIAQREVEIAFDDTWLTLSRKLDREAGGLIMSELPMILSGNNRKYAQDDSLATHNKRITPEFPMIDFAKMTDFEIYNLIRAQVYPLKGAYVIYNGKRIYFDSLIEYEKIKELRGKYAG